MAVASYPCSYLCKQTTAAVATRGDHDNGGDLRAQQGSAIIMSYPLGKATSCMCQCMHETRVNANAMSLVVHLRKSIVQSINELEDIRAIGISNERKYEH